MTNSGGGRLLRVGTSRGSESGSFIRFPLLSRCYSDELELRRKLGRVKRVARITPSSNSGPGRSRRLALRRTTPRPGRGKVRIRAYSWSIGVVLRSTSPSPGHNATVAHRAGAEVLGLFFLPAAVLAWGRGRSYGARERRVFWGAA